MPDLFESIADFLNSPLPGGKQAPGAKAAGESAVSDRALGGRIRDILATPLPGGDAEQADGAASPASTDDRTLLPGGKRIRRKRAKRAAEETAEAGPAKADDRKAEPKRGRAPKASKIGGRRRSSAAANFELDSVEAEAAPDVVGELREHDRALREAERAASGEEREEIEGLRKELDGVRRRYETAVSEQAKAHAEREDWTYTVQAGDSLASISARVYGSPAHARLIAEANRAQLERARRLVPGMTLLIPELDEDALQLPDPGKGKGADDSRFEKAREQLAGRHAQQLEQLEAMQRQQSEALAQRQAQERQQLEKWIASGGPKLRRGRRVVRAGRPGGQGRGRGRGRRKG